MIDQQQKPIQYMNISVGYDPDSYDSELLVMLFIKEIFSKLSGSDEARARIADWVMSRYGKADSNAR